MLNSTPKLRSLQTSSGLCGQLAAAVLLESGCYLLRIRGDILAPGFCNHARFSQHTPFELQPSISAGGPPHCRCFPICCPFTSKDPSNIQTLKAAEFIAAC